MACESITAEFTLNKLSFAHESKEEFLIGLWSWCQPKCYAGYRLSVAILLMAYLIFDIVWVTLFYFSHNPGYWFLYGMNWSFLLMVVSYFILAVLVMRYSFNEIIPSSVQIYAFWFFYNIGSTTVFLNSFIYWLSLFTSENDLFHSVSEMCKHSILVSFSILDLSVSAIPVRLCHFIYGMIVSVVYVMFAIFYTLLSGPTPQPSKVIYPNLKYRSVGGLILMLLSAIFISILAHTLLYTVYTIRMFVKDFTSDSSSRDEDSASRGSISSQMEISRRSSGISNNGSAQQRTRARQERSALPKDLKTYSTIN